MTSHVGDETPLPGSALLGRSFQETQILGYHFRKVISGRSFQEDHFRKSLQLGLPFGITSLKEAGLMTPSMFHCPGRGVDRTAHLWLDYQNGRLGREPTVALGGPVFLNGL